MNTLHIFLFYIVLHFTFGFKWIKKCTQVGALVSMFSFSDTVANNAPPRLFLQ